MNIMGWQAYFRTLSSEELDRLYNAIYVLFNDPVFKREYPETDTFLAIIRVEMEERINKGGVFRR